MAKKPRRRSISALSTLSAQEIREFLADLHVDDKDRLRRVAELPLEHSSGVFLARAELEGRRLAEIGRKLVAAGKKGGRRQPHRDRLMAREFQQRRRTSNLSDSALKEAIGRKFGLRRRAAIDAINRGLK